MSTIGSLPELAALSSASAVALLVLASSFRRGDRVFGLGRKARGQARGLGGPNSLASRLCSLLGPCFEAARDLRKMAALSLGFGDFRSFSDEDLEEFLRSVGSALRAGLSPYQAVKSAAARTSLSPKLRKMLESAVARHELGVSLAETFHDLADRNRILDLKLVAGAFDVIDAYGGDTPSLLDEIARAIRRRRDFRESSMAKASDARSSSMVLVLMPLAMAAYVFASQGDLMTHALTDPTGRLLLGAAAVFWAAGTALVFRIVRQAAGD